MPRVPPTIIPNSAVSPPTASEILAPYIVRLNMSRASWSVPNQCSELGEYGGIVGCSSELFWLRGFLVLHIGQSSYRHL